MKNRKTGNPKKQCDGLAFILQGSMYANVISKFLLGVVIVMLALSPSHAFAVNSESGEIATTGIAQQKGTCTGIVKDVTGETVIGASVVVKGTTNGTITGIDGDFTITNVEKGDIIQISFVGYLTQEIKWTGTPLHVVMKDDTQSLDEVVVVGYGTQKKVNLTGAVGVADGDVLEQRPIGNIAQGLQGVVPNLNITFDSGNPNAKTTFNVRGSTSLNGGTALLLVDGVEMSDLSLLNPQDVESVSVLKDASSAAVYGARAAFGVVLITTKKGSKGQKVVVNYNNNFSWSTPSKLPDGVAADKWINAINQTAKNESGPNATVFSQDLVDAISNHMKDPSRYPSSFVDETGTMTSKGQWAYAGNTDWFDVLYKDAAFMQQHNASVSGGSEKNSFYASLGYKGQDGLLAFGNDTYKRINMSFNFTSQLTKWLELSFRTKYNRTDSNNPNTQSYLSSDPYYEVYRAFPFIPLYLSNGTDFAGVAGSNFNYNIAGLLDGAGRSTDKRDDFWYTASFNLTPFKGLSVKGDYTGNQFFRQSRDHFKTIYQTMPNPTDTPLSQGATNSVGMAKYNDTYQALNFWAEYKTNIQDHSLSAMIGYNQESKKITKMQATSANLVANDFPILGLGENSTDVKEEATIWAVQGMFFRLNYDYKSRYLLEVNGRYDGSSKYASGDRWGFFPSASVGWRVSEEPFFESARGWMDNLKIRASLGSLGNQVTDGNFQYLGYLQSESLGYLMGNSIISGMKPATLAGSNITWEKVVTTNFGLDFSLLNGRLVASADYYIRNTDNMVVSKAYPAVLGTSGGKENLANMRTNGWELSLSWNDKINSVGGSPMTYSIGIGLADSYSTITKYDNPTGSLADHYVGKRLGEIWGYTTDGFIQTVEEAQKMATVQSKFSATWTPGDIRYADLNKDGAVNDGDPTKGAINTLSNHGDKRIIGNSSPRYHFNINAGLSWKGFDLRAFFEGVAKRDLWLDNEVFWGVHCGGVWWQALNDYQIDNSWTPTNTNAYYPIMSWNSRSKQVQTKYMQDASYIRLKDLTLSYTIPMALTSKVGINQLKVFVSGQNIWEATGLYKYVDPDATNKLKDKDNVELDLGAKVYPFSRSYSFGINVTF